jgi:hypothetical protein
MAATPFFELQVHRLKVGRYVRRSAWCAAMMPSYYYTFLSEQASATRSAYFCRWSNIWCKNSASSSGRQAIALTVRQGLPDRLIRRSVTAKTE